MSIIAKTIELPQRITSQLWINIGWD